MPRPHADWLRCPVCGTRIRGEIVHNQVYTDDYPVTRAHHHPAVGRCKVRSLEYWLTHLGLEVGGRVVCEIGFGGGACLAALQRAGATVFGTEPVRANREHAQALGIPRGNVFDVEPLPNLPQKINFWILQDSFEHVPDPNALTYWMADHSSADALVLLVAPDVESISRKLMGRFWLHEVPDHWVHYSRRGVLAIFARAGFRLLRQFRPLKLVSLGMASSHLRLVARAPARQRNDRHGVRLWFNLGEMGLLLQRNDDRG